MSGYIVDFQSGNTVCEAENAQVDNTTCPVIDMTNQCPVNVSTSQGEDSEVSTTFPDKFHIFARPCIILYLSYNYL
ncbi:hypothetical protein AC249_AIPGENE6398 [Exaiptasia diaphana]|nr:hypothetical protein AC249_AIPGENE6398 [Exaiptasia diaphana]